MQNRIHHLQVVADSWGTMGIETSTQVLNWYGIIYCAELSVV